MTLRRLWVCGAGVLTLGIGACGGKRLADEHGNDTAGEQDDAGLSADVTQSDAGRSQATAVNGTQSASGGRCDTVTADPERSTVETSTAGDAGVASDDSSSDEAPTTGPLGVEKVSFADGECPDDSWCWAAHAPIGDKFTAVRGTPDGSTVFAVGAQGACVQYDEATQRWTIHRSSTRGDLLDVEVVSATEVWVAGADGLDFYDGNSWQRQLTGWTSSIVRGVNGELWAINDEQLYVYAAGAWNLLVPSVDGNAAYPAGGGVFDIVAGDTEGELWAVTYQDRARAYHELEVVKLEQGTWTRLDGEFAESYWPKVVRYSGGLYFADGTSWFDIDAGWQAVDVLPDFWTNIDDTTIGIRGTSLSAVTDSDARVIEVPTTNALWGARSDTLWLALGGGGLMRANYLTGTTTEPAAQPASPWHTTTGIEWSASETDAWRGPDLEHFDGTTWSKPTMEAAPPFVVRINGSATDNVWFVAYASATPWRWDGNLLQEVIAPNPDGQLVRVHAFDADTVWAAEVNETNASIRRFEGSGWSDVKSWTVPGALFPDYIVDIAGPGVEDAYVALRDHVEHFDGEQWTTIFTAPDGEVFTAMAADSERLWVLGQDYVYHRTASGEWQPEWYAFQAMDWLGLTADSVWIMGGWLSEGGLYRSTQ